MKSKNQVYVKVDSKKVAKKLKKVLEMFGEKVFSDNSIDQALRKGWVMEFYMGDWCNNSSVHQWKTKVTVKQLKQILFREHAKEGDVFIGRNVDVDFVCVYDSFKDPYYRVSNWRSLTEDDFYSNESNNPGDIENFIRYATEEEKALLNPVKGLETGKWYSGNGEKLIFVSELSECGELARGYGIGANGNWYDDDGSFSWTTADLKEATKEEIETALRKEAEKRYGKDWKTVKIKEHANGSMGNVNCGEFANNVSLNYVWNKNGMILHCGKWAEKLEDLPKINALDVAVVEKLSDIVEKHCFLSNKPPIINDARQLAEKLRKLL